MLRITEEKATGRIVRLRLDGAISADNAEELSQLCARYRTEAERSLIIDMEGVNFMTPEAARKLAGMRTDSLRLINCSPFISTLLDTTTDSQ